MEMKMKNEVGGNWESKRLGEIVSIRTGKLDANASSESGQYPFFTCSKEPLKIDSFSYDCECVLVAGNGDLNVKYYLGKFDAYQRTYIIESKDSQVLSVRYLYYFLDTYLEKLREQSIGGVIKYIKLENLTEAKLPLPPLATQQRIAAILDAADALRRKDQELLRKYDELAQAIFIDMFGDPVKNEKGWEVKKLGDIVKMKAGSFVSASEIRMGLEDNLYPCFGGNGLRGFVKSFTHDGKYILIGRQGALCGNIKIAEGKFHATEHAVVCASTIEYNLLWMYYLLAAVNLNKYASGAAQPGLNVGTLEEIQVVFVPIELQNEFAKRIELIDRQNADLRVNLNYTQDLFNTLIQRAFNGELVS